LPWIRRTSRNPARFASSRYASTAEATSWGENEWRSKESSMGTRRTTGDPCESPARYAGRSVVARFALSLESPQQLIGYAITRKAYNFPADYWDKYPAQIVAVKADDVQRVAWKYINPGTMQVVAVGDAGKIKAALEKYGPVEIVDASGKAAPETKKAKDTSAQ